MARGEAYCGRYGMRRLERWRKALSGLPGVRERRIYFDNDEAGYAFRDALTLKQVIG